MRLTIKYPVRAAEPRKHTQCYRQNTQLDLGGPAHSLEDSARQLTFEGVKRRDQGLEGTCLKDAAREKGKAASSRFEVKTGESGKPCASEGTETHQLGHRRAKGCDVLPNGDDKKGSAEVARPPTPFGHCPLADVTTPPSPLGGHLVNVFLPTRLRAHRAAARLLSFPEHPHPPPPAPWHPGCSRASARHFSR